MNEQQVKTASWYLADVMKEAQEKRTLHPALTGALAGAALGGAPGSENVETRMPLAGAGE